MRVPKWDNIKFYLIAFLIILTGNLVSTALQLLESQFPEVHPLNRLAANLSGVTVGGMLMVLGFLRDGRLDDERQRTASAQEEAKTAQKEAKTAQDAAKTAQEEAKTAREEAAQQRQRADRAEAELARLRTQYQGSEILDRIRRLEELNGIVDPRPQAADPER